MYENKKEKLASKEVFFNRIKKNALLAFAILIISLAMGVVGYKITIPQFGWYDSLLNASMILSGMGPVVASDICLTNVAKVFSSFYALFSGITFLSTFGIFIAPIIHRFFHRLHIDESDEN